MKFEEVPVNINPKTVEKDDWDIETWRRDYPVDYLKMFKILMDIEPGLKQIVIFQELKKILSFYIPEKLYKYCSLSKEIVIDDISIIFMQLLFCNLKHSSWEYENEFKCTMAANAKGMPFADAKPYEIYVGINCAVDHERRLKRIANDKGIDIYKMCFDELSLDYNMIPQKIK